jgi:class 3 adenylate cyclase/tetratricopeptide (TPR) repeat protein
MECPHCKFENPDGMNFCGNCGKPMPRAISPRLPSYTDRSPREYTPPFLLKKILVNRTALKGERKYVSVLFADVSGFTSLSETLDPEDIHEVMDGCFEILGQEIHNAGGTINQYTGDGVMALFGAPVAYEDHVNRACHAALRVQHRMKRYTGEVKNQYGILFRLRVGINAGTVVVGAIGDNLRLDYTALGDATNLAARLESLAPPGGILVSRPIKEAAQHAFVFHPEGNFNIKGKKSPVAVFALLRKTEQTMAPATGSAAPPFVNREKELSLLMRAHERALTGQFQIVALEGEGGVGKSRLLAAFQVAISQEETLFLHGRCQPYGEATALYPVTRMFGAYFDIKEHDSLKCIKKKLKEKIDYRDFLPKLDKILELFGDSRNENLSATLFEREKRRMFRSVADLLKVLLRNSPMVLLFDDMQWVDRTTLDFLAFLSRSSIKGPLLVVCSGRPTRTKWCPEAPDKFIYLDPLKGSASRTLFHSVLGTTSLEEGESRKIVSHAGGNPLFLIEMAQTIRKQNLMVCDANICRLRLDIEELEIPQSIRGVLSARLDALPDAVKRTVQLAAVIGREFSHDLLACLTGEAARLKQRLRLLQEEGIIDGISLASKDRYVFRHQLMQEIAYDSLLRKNRRHYHHEVGECIEKIYRNSLNKQIGFLAHHFYLAGDWQKALAYTLQAGDRARRSFACREALICFDRALDILQKEHWEHSLEQALQIYKWKAGMHFCLGQLNRSHQTFHRMLNEAKHLNDKTSEGEALFRLGWTSFFNHKPLIALKFLQAAIDLAQMHNLQETLLKATGFKGLVYSVLGDLKRAKPLLIQSIDLSEEPVSIEGKAWGLSYLLQYYNWTGELSEALAVSDELWQLNESLKSPFFNIVLHFRKGLVYGALGNLNKARNMLEAGLKTLETGDEAFWKPRFLNTLGWIKGLAQQPEKALELNQEALQLALTTGNAETIYNAQINVGENYLQLGDFESAGKVLNAILNQIKHRRHLYAGWRYRTRLLISLGALSGKEGEQQKALYYINQALKIARKNGASKHEAMALRTKAAIVYKNRPKTARTYLEAAHDLAARMGSKPLLKDIRETMKNLENP